MLSKFAIDNGASSSNSAGLSDQSEPSTPKVHVSEIRFATHQPTIASESHEAEQSLQGRHYNNKGNGICCNCAESTKDYSSTAQTESELATSTAVPSRNISPSASADWESHPPSQGPKKVISFSGSCADLPTSSVSGLLPDPSRSPPTPDTSDSSSSPSKEDSKNYAPYTFHEMSKLSEACMSSGSSSPSGGETRADTGRFTYAEVLQRQSPPAHVTITPSAFNEPDYKQKRSTVERWMREKNTPEQLKKLSNL